jgi:hypothetical protein
MRVGRAYGGDELMDLAGVLDALGHLDTKSEVAFPGSFNRRRSAMPVRDLIHSSFVSTMDSNTLFEST